ncbi:hypothetical protein [Streptomyces sp. NPDC056921]|uniref:hypothetical protein n=1 Tax=Streptomyces sp. NPDC056921 TaxID=3345966 RepID=UPI003640FB0C
MGQRIADEATLDSRLGLCRTLAGASRFAWLPASAGECVRVTLRLDDMRQGAHEATELIDAFVVRETGTRSAPRALKRFRLVPAMLRLPADVGRLRGRPAESNHRDLDPVHGRARFSELDGQPKQFGRARPHGPATGRCRLREQPLAG